MDTPIAGTGVFRNIYFLHDSGVAFEGCVPWVLLESPGDLEQKGTNTALCSFSIRYLDIHGSYIVATELLSTSFPELVGFQFFVG